MVNYKTILGINTLIVVGALAFIFGLDLLGSSVKGLFFPPCSATYPGAGFFFLTFQMLFYLSVMVCIFSFGLLTTTQPGRPENQFVLSSGILTGGFLFNEVFRTHVHLGRAGVPKAAIAILYAIIAIAYLLTFRRAIKSTPYPLLIGGIVLLFLAFFIEALPIPHEGVGSLLEGIPKILSGINIALYFWFLCKGLILRSLKFSPEV